MPFDMQPGQLAMNFNGQSSTLSGSRLLTQQGQINLSGDGLEPARQLARPYCGQGRRVRIRTADGALGRVARRGL